MQKRGAVVKHAHARHFIELSPRVVSAPVLQARPIMSQNSSQKRVLDPVQRISEGLFGLIMVLTFTGSLSVATADRDDVRAMLIGALGCNIAWGVIDGVLFVLGALAERASALRLHRAIRDANDASEAHRIVAAAAPGLAKVLQLPEIESIRARLRQQPEPPPHTKLHLDDFRSAFAVFLLVFFTTFPVAIPFLLMHEVGPAMRTSNTIAIAMLFLLGLAYGRITGMRAWLMGVSMVALGLSLVGMTIALGG